MASSPRVSPVSTSKKSSSHHSKHSPPSEEQQDKYDKECHSSSFKHEDKQYGDETSKHRSDKEGNRTPHKHHLCLCHSSLLSLRGQERSLTMRSLVRPSMPTQTPVTEAPPGASAIQVPNLPSWAPISTSTLNKIREGLHPHSCSNDSRCSITPFDPAKIHQLTTECQALGSELAKQFQNISICSSSSVTLRLELSSRELTHLPRGLHKLE